MDPLTGDLSDSAEQWLNDAERRVTAGQAVAGLLSDLVVQARSASGQVTVHVDTAGRLRDIEFERDVFRYGSRQARSDVMEAYRRAVAATGEQADVLARHRRLGDEERRMAQRVVAMQQGRAEGPAPVGAQLRRDGGSW